MATVRRILATKRSARGERVPYDLAGREPLPVGQPGEALLFEDCANRMRKKEFLRRRMESILEIPFSALWHQQWETYKILMATNEGKATNIPSNGIDFFYGFPRTGRVFPRQSGRGLPCLCPPDSLLFIRCKHLFRMDMAYSQSSRHRILRRTSIGSALIYATIPEVSRVKETSRLRQEHRDER